MTDRTCKNLKKSDKSQSNFHLHTNENRNEPAHDLWVIIASANCKGSDVSTYIQN